MAGNILAKEFAAVTLESSGSSQANNTQVAASTANLDNRSGGITGAESYAFDFELNGGFGSSPAVGAVIGLYAVPAIDGTNFADVDTSNHNMPPACFIGTFVVNKAQTTAQRLVVLGVPLDPLLYKIYIDNQSGQTLSSTWTLKVVPSQSQYT